nr:hypothetical protein [Gammaproteobacteria bacterium]
MTDDRRSTSSQSSAIENIDRWKRAMDGIAASFVETGVNPAEAIFVMAKCIGHSLQEIPDPNEREKLLGNLMNISRRIMHQADNEAQETFTWS